MPVRLRVTVEGTLPPREHGPALQSEFLRVVGGVAPWVASEFHQQARPPRPYALTPVKPIGHARGPRDSQRQEPERGCFEIGVLEDRWAEAVLHALDDCEVLRPRGARLVVTDIAVRQIALDDLTVPTPASVSQFCAQLADFRGESPLSGPAPSELSREWWFNAREPVVVRAPDGARLDDRVPFAPISLLGRAANRCRALLGIDIEVPPVATSIDWSRESTLRAPKAGGAPERGTLGAFRLRTTEDEAHRRALSSLALTMLVLGAGDRTPFGRGFVVGHPAHWSDGSD